MALREPAGRGPPSGGSPLRREQGCRGCNRNEPWRSALLASFDSEIVGFSRIGALHRPAIPVAIPVSSFNLEVIICGGTSGRVLQLLLLGMWVTSNWLLHDQRRTR